MLFPSSLWKNRVMEERRRLCKELEEGRRRRAEKASEDFEIIQSQEK